MPITTIFVLITVTILLISLSLEFYSNKLLNSLESDTSHQESVNIIKKTTSLDQICYYLYMATLTLSLFTLTLFFN